MTPSTAAPRSSRPWLGIALGCVFIFACGIIAVAAIGGFWFLRNRAPTSRPTVEYILDASPRMTQASEGSTRLSIAQGVLAEIVRPADAAVTAGLRVFGTGHQPAACQDTDLLVPLAPASQGRISDQLVALTAGAGADAAMADAMVAAIRDLVSTAGPHTLVVVTGGTDSCNPEAGQLIASEAAKAGIKLELFVVGFQVSDEEAAAIKGMVDQTSGSTYLSASDESELRRTLAAIQAHVDNPTTTTVTGVLATAGAPVPLATGVPPTAGSPQPTGLLELAVLAFAGQPAQGGGRLIVAAFNPQDHENPLATDYGNPTSLQAPAGVYDLRISYYTSDSSPYSGGTIEQWLEGVAIVAGETTAQTFDLKLGEATVAILEAAGKPIVDMSPLFAYRIYRQGDREHEMSWIIYTSTVTLQLPGGFYEAVVDFPNTDLNNWEQPDQTFEVIPGESRTYSFNLKLGRLYVEVVDSTGQPIDPEGLFAYVYPAAQPDKEFGYSFSLNPLDLPLQAGVPYNIRLGLGDGRTLDLTGQQVGEGEIKQIKVNLSDFN